MTITTQTRRATARGVWIFLATLLAIGCGEEPNSAIGADEIASPEKAALSVNEEEERKPRVRKVSGTLPKVGPFEFPPSVETLEAGFDSPEHLLWVAVKAIDAGDRDLLRDLLIEQSFYLDRLFPEFVAEKPTLEGRGEFHWDHLEMKSLSGILDLVRELSGKGLEFQLVTPEFVKPYKTFRLHRHPSVKVKEKSGRSFLISPTNDIVEFDGKFKLLGYPN